jgi:phosphopantothenoylcysteine decarboxylase
MWRHPITDKQLKVLQEEWGYSSLNPDGWVTVLPPIVKSLACGDVGTGAMMDWRDVVRTVQEHLGLSVIES